MDEKDVNVRLVYRAELNEGVYGNIFSNIPDDIAKLIHDKDGTLRGVVENLHPNQCFEIEISIKSIKNNG